MIHTFNSQSALTNKLPIFYLTNYLYLKKYFIKIIIILCYFL